MLRLGPALFLAWAMVSAPTAKADLITFALLSGDQEVPPVETDALGSATLVYDTVAQTFDLTMVFEGIEITELQNVGDFSSMHIHSAPIGMNGPIIIDLLAPDLDFTFVFDSSLVRSTYTGTGISIAGVNHDIAGNEAALFAHHLYINIHTREHPGGEIRGQLVPEPSTYVLMGLGLVGLAALRHSRRHAVRQPRSAAA